MPNRKTMNFADESFLPQLPTFSDELVNECNNSKDFRPILFQYCKFISNFCYNVNGGWFFGFTDIFAH